MEQSPKIGFQHLLRPEDSAVMLNEPQPYEFANLQSREFRKVIKNVVGLAKIAAIKKIKR